MSATKWNASLMLPTDSNYTNRIVGATFAPSNKGNPMITLECEITQPQEVEIDGQQVTIAGVKTKNFYPTTVLEDGVVNEEKTNKSRKRLVDQLWDKLEMDAATINWDNVDVKPLLGKLILTQMEAEVEEKRKSPTAAELAKDKNAQGQVMRNPKTGKALVNYWPKIREIFGLAVQDGTQVPY